MAEEKQITGESKQTTDLAAGVIIITPPEAKESGTDLKTDPSGIEEEGAHPLRKVIEHSHNDVDSDRIWWEELKGFIEVVSAAPTHIPKLLSDSIKLYGSTLYIYDYVANSWKTIGGSNTYGGSSSGSVLPAGWSITNPSTGNYQVTHNLGYSNYALVLSVHSLAIALISGKGSTTFNVNTKTTAGVDSNTSFDFVLVKIV